MVLNFTQLVVHVFPSRIRGPKQILQLVLLHRSPNLDWITYIDRTSVAGSLARFGEQKWKSLLIVSRQ